MDCFAKYSTLYKKRIRNVAAKMTSAAHAIPLTCVHCVSHCRQEQISKENVAKAWEMPETIDKNSNDALRCNFQFSFESYQL